MKKRPILLVLMMAFLTQGIYLSYWLYRVGSEIRSDFSEAGLGRYWFMSVTIGSLLYFVASLIGIAQLLDSLFGLSLFPTSTGAVMWAYLLSFVCAAYVVFFCFRIRKNLNAKILDKSGDYTTLGDSELNSIKTFLLNILYIQYCLNKVVMARKNSSISETPNRVDR